MKFALCASRYNFPSYRPFIKHRSENWTDCFLSLMALGLKDFQISIGAFSCFSLDITRIC